MNKELRILAFVAMFLLIPVCKTDRPGTLKWKYKTGGPIESSPAIGQDGTVYITSMDSCLYAFSPDGNLKWKYQTGGKIYASPAIGVDGTVYINSLEGYTYAITPEGKLKWKCETWIAPSSPVIGHDGTVFVADEDGRLYAITPEGELKWESSQFMGGMTMFPPAIGTDGTIYVSIGKVVYAVDTLGNLKWSFEVPGSWVRTISSLAINKQGRVCFCTNEGGFYILTPEGEYNYCLDLLLTSEWTSPVIDTDGSVYLGGIYFYALNPDYRKKWMATEEIEYRDVESAVAIGSDGAIYFGAGRTKSYLYALTSDGKVKWKCKLGGEIKSSPAIGTDGTVYVVSLDSCVYAIRSDSKGLADSPWPKFQHDNQNTGRASGGI